MDLKEHLKTLTELTGPSGHETAIRAYLREQWADLVDRFEVDGLGSLVGIKHGRGQEPRKRIMLSAHMDEIGLMVVEIKNGYLRMERVGGIDPRVLLAMPVLIHAREKTLKGVVAAVPPHISGQQSGNKGYPEMNEMWVDLGLPTEEVEKLVQVGDIATMDAPLLELMGDHVAGKALDDRASVASVTACLEYLQTRNHEWDVYAVASVQEEVGLKGAKTAAYYTKPDLAIAIDVEFAQQPGVSGDEHVELGKGPTIGMGPNFHEGLYDSLHETAKNIEMSLFAVPTPSRSGTDAWAIQVSRQGVPTALLGVPVRNMHSPIEMASMKDIERTGRLMAEFISELDSEFLDKIAWKPDEVEDTAEEDKE
jgi:endoglucanase